MSGPLKGLKILDFTTLLSGPYATITLADLGAQMLRIVSVSSRDLEVERAKIQKTLEGYFKLRLTTGNTLSKITHRIE